ncbi:MAG: 3-methyl-2-oxobutanoate hydroxymethyltransferase [Planctomycetota bacterium]|nr:MAG: 3-methyl-2-oxobutanoate hydroxymethyltransferase [Planctomycetota bacterium]
MSAQAKITLATLRAMKREGRKFSVLTCYDCTMARLIEGAGVESILVGDTYAEVCLGHPTTLPATMDQMITITQAVRRGAPNVYLIGDMPYLSYQVSVEEAIRNAGRFMSEGGCDAVKIEVDSRLAPTVETMSAASIPIVAHLGLRPQSIHVHGGYRVQGRDVRDARRLMNEAAMMERAGAVMLLLEAVPLELAERIATHTELPVIGCVSGSRTDAQVVVLHDVLGLGAGHPPRSVKRYAELNETCSAAFRAYAADVRAGRFPIDALTASLGDEALSGLDAAAPDGEVVASDRGA